MSTIYVSWYHGYVMTNGSGKGLVVNLIVPPWVKDVYSERFMKVVVYLDLKEKKSKNARRVCEGDDWSLKVTEMSEEKFKELEIELYGSRRW